MIKIILVNFAVIFFAVSVFSQTPQEIENILVENITQIQKYSSYDKNYDDDKLSESNSIFEKNLLKFTNLSSTLKYDFPELSKLMLISTSEDEKFRVYSWDSETGGTMHDYSRVYQFVGNDGKINSKTEDNAEDEGNMGSFVNSVYNFQAKTGMVYIVCSTFIGSTSDHYQSANLMKIKENNIEDVKLIKTKQGLTNSLGFEYNFFSVVDREERPIRLIQFDKKTNTLSIPVVVSDEKNLLGTVTDRVIKYRFNGKYFVKVK
jgi:hypothetical protein